jgi:hypothetical protein
VSARSSSSVPFAILPRPPACRCSDLGQRSLTIRSRSVSPSRKGWGRVFARREAHEPPGPRVRMRDGASSVPPSVTEQMRSSTSDLSRNGRGSFRSPPTRSALSKDPSCAPRPWCRPPVSGPGTRGSTFPTCSTRTDALATSAASPPPRALRSSVCPGVNGNRKLISCRQGGFYRRLQHFQDHGGCVVVISSCEEGAGAASAVGQASAVRGATRARVEHLGRGC